MGDFGSRGTPATQQERVGSRGLGEQATQWDTPRVESIESIYDFREGRPIGCPEMREDLVLDDGASDAAVRAFVGRIAFLVGFRNSTACLLRFATMIEPHITLATLRKSPRGYLQLLEIAVDIYETVQTRTRGPWRQAPGPQLFAQLDPRVLSIWPMNDAAYRQRKNALAARNAVVSGRAMVLDSWRLDEQAVGIAADWEKDLARIEASARETELLAALLATEGTDMPLVNLYIRRLDKLSFAMIEAQTRARHPPQWHAFTVLDHVEVIVYHSIYSVVLDKRGNPHFGAGFPYAMILAGVKPPMERTLPAPGYYLSTSPHADNQLQIRDNGVRSIVIGGIGGFMQREVTGAWDHPLNVKLQAYIRQQGLGVLPSIVASEAFDQSDVTLSNVIDRIPAVVVGMARYVVPEVERRLADLYENFAAILKEVGIQALRGLIIGRVKAWLITFIGKKIGKRFVPGVAVVSAIAELFDDSERDMIAAIIACLVMAARSTRRDDMTISSKILSKIAIDKVQDAVVERLVERATKAGMALVPRRRGAAKAASKSNTPGSGGAAPRPPGARTAADAASAGAEKTAPEVAGGKAPPEAAAGKAAKKPPAAKATPKAAAAGADEPSQPDPATSQKPAHMARPKEAERARKRPDETDRANTHPPVDDGETRRSKRDLDNERRKVTTRPLRPTAKRRPTEPPIGPARMAPSGRWKFLKANRARYSENVRRMIEEYEAEIDLKRKQRKSRKVQQTRVDAIEDAIKAQHAKELGDHWRLPVVKVIRLQRSRRTGKLTAGAEHEQTMYRVRTGEDREYTAVVATKSGDGVEVDDYDPVTRTVIEHKSSLDFPEEVEGLSQHQIETKMTRQAELVEDHKLAGVLWVPMSESDQKKMDAALTALREKAAGNTALQARLARIRIGELYDIPVSIDDD